MECATASVKGGDCSSGVADASQNAIENNLFETLIDVASIAVGSFELYKALKEGDDKAAIEAAVAVGLDSLAAVIPFVPGGASIALKAAKAAEKLKKGKNLTGPELEALRAFNEASKKANKNGVPKKQTEEYNVKNKTSTGKTANQLTRAADKGQTPRGIGRTDSGKELNEKLHVHITDKNGKEHALNVDGTWKHGKMNLTKKQREWLSENGFKLPK